MYLDTLRSLVCPRGAGTRPCLGPYAWKECCNVELIVASGSILPFKTGAFDVVPRCNVVDIVAEPLALVDESLRLLKPGGLLLTSDPYQFYGVGMKRLKTQSRRSPIKRGRVSDDGKAGRRQSWGY